AQSYASTQAQGNTELAQGTAASQDSSKKAQDPVAIQDQGAAAAPQAPTNSQNLSMLDQGAALADLLRSRPEELSHLKMTDLCTRITDSKEGLKNLLKEEMRLKKIYHGITLPAESPMNALLTILNCTVESNCFAQQKALLPDQSEPLSAEKLTQATIVEILPSLRSNDTIAKLVRSAGYNL
ncbi:MAG: hypothetical protein HOI80_02855, partial [Alphaproteobacteria bacterium]|nr:hypothetical protein [Alphaproteobacteria bacterium]